MLAVDLVLGETRDRILSANIVTPAHSRTASLAKESTSCSRIG
jgi:hypothetical protein